MVNLIPNSLHQHYKNYMAYSKENYSKDLRGEKVNLMQSPGLRCTKLNYLLDTEKEGKEDNNKK